MKIVVNGATRALDPGVTIADVVAGGVSPRRPA